MNLDIKWFLLVFSKIKQKLIISDEYSDYREAMKHYNESERKYFRNNLGDSSIDNSVDCAKIVLIAI
ncbi:MAG: hypothetical protein LBT99_02800 [Bifidobacteriaceae bacterium]|jgi:hypothetical protein|nr:hypothetical protein [Bifidobacteriaceae bacterium]